jgi:hypothetical protein
MRLHAPLRSNRQVVLVDLLVSSDASAEKLSLINYIAAYFVSGQRIKSGYSFGRGREPAIFRRKWQGPQMIEAGCDATITIERGRQWTELSHPIIAIIGSGALSRIRHT